MIVNDERVARFVSDACGVAFVAPYTCMGLERDGQIVCGVIFNVFEEADVHFSVAGHGWTRAFLSEVGRYVFDTLGCERMTALTEQAHVVSLALRLGGEVEGRMRNHFGKGRDAFIIGILKNDWKF